jgi:hypothetical protein
MRFEERLRPHFQIDPSVRPGPLPSLLLQPLVENAIKYAVTPQEEGADISVEVARHRPGADHRLRHRPGRRRDLGVGASSRPESVWPIFGTVWRRPMATDHRFETNRT